MKLLCFGRFSNFIGKNMIIRNRKLSYFGINLSCNVNEKSKLTCSMRAIGQQQRMRSFPTSGTCHNQGSDVMVVGGRVNLVTGEGAGREGRWLTFVTACAGS